MEIEKSVLEKRVLICLDKFKGTCDAITACEAVQKGLHKIELNNKNDNVKFLVRKLPMTDGGDGFLTLLQGPLQLEIKEMDQLIQGPLIGQKIKVKNIYLKNIFFFEISKELNCF